MRGESISELPVPPLFVRVMNDVTTVVSPIMALTLRPQGDQREKKHSREKRIRQQVCVPGHT